MRSLVEPASVPRPIHHATRLDVPGHACQPDEGEDSPDNIYYARLVAEYYKLVWMTVDKQFFLDKGLD